MFASSEPMLKSLGKPLEHKFFVLKEKDCGFLQIFSLYPSFQLHFDLIKNKVSVNDTDLTPAKIRSPYWR